MRSFVVIIALAAAALAAPQGDQDFASNLSSMLSSPTNFSTVGENEAGS
jgi:hypothetical protein